MKNLAQFSFILLCSFSFNGHAQYTHENLRIKSSEEHSNEAVSNPDHFDHSFSHGNLRLYAIIANDAFVEEHKDLGRFTLLKDAIATDKIVITETGARHLADNQDALEPIDTVGRPTNEPIISNSEPVQIQNIQNLSLDGEFNQSYGEASGVSGTVNTLFAQNNSADTIFIMAGEVVKGGKQDRVIGQDVVIAPNEKVDLSAFCVEQSRWTTKDGNGGQFTDYYNVSSMDIRKAVTEDQDQSKVWSTVDNHTKINGAESDTRAYTNLENSKEFQKETEEYLEKFGNAFANDPKVIGVIAVTGNEIIGCDMFATHELFIGSYSNLIHSYVGHAITNGSEVSISNEQVFAYLDEILKDEKNQEEIIEKNGTVYKWKKKKLHITRY